MINADTEIQQVLQNFQDGYTERNVAKLDDFMKLFVHGDDTELIGIGAYARIRMNGFKELNVSAKSLNLIGNIGGMSS